jgi:hypothetical protein
MGEASIACRQLSFDIEVRLVGTYSEMAEHGPVPQTLILIEFLKMPFLAALAWSAGPAVSGFLRSVFVRGLYHLLLLHLTHRRSSSSRASLALIKRLPE